MIRSIRKRIVALCMALCFTLVSLNAVAANAINEEASDSQSDVTISSINDYSDYLASLEDNYYEGENINLAPADSGFKHSNVDGKSGIELSSKQRIINYSFTPDKSGRYNVEISYYALSGKSKDVVFSLYVNDKLPFDEAQSISLTRIYKDDGEIVKDENGNELRPTQVEVSRWNTAVLSNSDGYYNDPYELYFEAGKKYAITFAYSEESMLIGEVFLTSPKGLVSYEEYSKGAAPANECITLIQAEKSFEKSSSMLYPTYDRSSPATMPSHYSKMIYNTIGQSNWSHQGQWISWKINIEKDGWYSVAFKARQNYQQGINSYRTFAIDNKIPFKEIANIEFPYSLNWYQKILTDESGTPYLFYFSKGEHTLSLTVAAGPMGTLLKSLSDAVLDLNGIYRSIIMVTGTTPDKYRTYYLEESVPGLIDNMKSLKESLDVLYKQICEVTGATGSQASVIQEMSIMLENFIKKPLSIPTRISAFKDNIESLGSLILTLSEQPLELDYISVYSKSELPSVKASFWSGLTYSIKGFLASFTEDYNSIGSAVDNSEHKSNITVWISNGRDQAQILKNLIDNKFTPKTGIGVKLSIVSTAAGTSSSTLVQATLAGKGPDVALFTPKDTPVNLAMRGALTDVSRLDGFDEIYGQFYESAWIPYIYESGIYAVPETQNYDMLFYRADIFKELGLKVPNTWEEFYSIVEILQKNHLGIGVLETNAVNAGISSGISFFEKLLLQNGGTYYNDKYSATAFQTTASVNAFKDWTELYTKYGLDRSFDFFNRFRTGEMPIGIMSYTTYNQLYAAAPEIRGLWAMTVIPGTLTEDGKINRAETAAGTACVMLKDCSDKESAWSFIRWWTGSDAQSSYGSELEASLGVAARYDVANIEAFDNIGWTDSESAVLKSQWESVTDIRQIPGNYFISRCLTNAFRTAVDDNLNPIRSLNIYRKDMDAEITRKRAEFHLE